MIEHQSGKNFYRLRLVCLRCFLDLRDALDFLVLRLLLFPPLNTVTGGTTTPV